MISLSGPRAGRPRRPKFELGHRQRGHPHVERVHLLPGHRAAQTCHGRRAIEVQHHVFFAAPGHLDRLAGHGRGQPHGLYHVVRLEAPAEATAHQHGVQVHLGGVEAGDLGRLLTRRRGILHAGPNVELALMQPGHGVHRLHRCVRQEGNAVLGLERRAVGQSLVDVAIVAQPAVAVLLAHRCNDAIHHRRRAGRVAGPGPVALHGLRGLEGAPGVVGDDGDTAGQVDHLQHAEHRLGGGGVEADERGAHYRVHANGGKHHVGQPHVDAEGCRADALGHHVDPRHRLAEVAPLLTRFQRRAGRQVDRGRCRRQFQIGQASAVGGDDAAVVGLQLRRG